MYVQGAWMQRKKCVGCLCQNIELSLNYEKDKVWKVFLGQFGFKLKFPQINVYMEWVLIFVYISKTLLLNKLYNSHKKLLGLMSLSLSVYISTNFIFVRNYTVFAQYYKAHN